VGDLFCSKPRPRFKLASVFTPTKFCRQALTLKESLVAADIPLELLATAPDHTQFVLLSLMHCPVKIVSSLAQCCRIFFSLGGGGISRHLKRATMSDMSLGGTQNKHPRLTQEEKVVIPIGVESMRIWWEGNTATLAHLSKSHMSSYTPPVTTTITELAVKSDSADVPIHLWDNQIAFLLGVPTLTPTQMAACYLPGSSGGLCIGELYSEMNHSTTSLYERQVVKLLNTHYVPLSGNGTMVLPPSSGGGRKTLYVT
jgi:hypothetical protein